MTMNNVDTLIIANILLAITYGLYFAFLKNRISYGASRVWIISSSMLAVISPLLHFTISSIELPPVITIQLEPVVVGTGSSVVNSSLSEFQFIIAIAFFLGSLYFLFRLLHGLIRLYQYTKMYSVIRIGSIRYYSIDEDSQAFSFFNHIFIPGEQLFSVISLHEEQHSRLWHSADMLLMRLLSLVFWINPVYWIMHAELRNIHEFQADDAVLKAGTNKAFYQTTLLHASIGTYKSMPVSHLRSSLLKTRITMMNNVKKHRNAALRISFALLPAVAAFIITACGNSDNKSQDETKSDSTVMKDTSRAVAESEKQETRSVNDNEKFETVDKMPEFPGGQAAMSQFIVENVTYPQKARSNGIQGTVYVNFTIGEGGEITQVGIEKSVSPELDAEAIRVVNQMPRWKPGENKGKPVSVSMTLPIHFKLG